MTVYKTILLSTPPDISSFMNKYCKGNGICKWKKIHEEEILKLVEETLECLKNISRETAITQAVEEKKKNETTKICPNKACGIRYPKSCRKCTSCGEWYEQCLNENGGLDQIEDQCMESDSWRPDKYCNHFASNHLSNSLTTQVIEPLLSNPKSKINVLALLNHIKRSAYISGTVSLPNSLYTEDSLEREENRQWTFVASDALIALQV